MDDRLENIDSQRSRLKAVRQNIRMSDTVAGKTWTELDDINNEMHERLGKTRG